MSKEKLATTAEPEPQWAAFVALDWADQKHYWKLVVAGSQKQEEGELENTPEAVAAWAADLNVRFGGSPVAMCVEQSRGSLVYMLLKFPQFVLFPVHPKMSASMRKALYPSGSKSDPSDTGVLLTILLHHRDKLRRLNPDTVETRLLQRLAEQRRLMVNEKTRQSNRLTACLKLYFPQILTWFDDPASPLVGAVLEKWPSLEQLQRAHDGTLRKFFHQHNCRSEERIQERIDAIRQAVSATTDAAVLGAESIAARSYGALIATLRTIIAEYDEQIAKVFAAHPEVALFDGLPGAGAALAPRLLVAFGTDRQRYATAHELECYSGIAPVRSASGQSQWIHFRWACPKFLRQTFHEFAGHSIVKSKWARAYYDLQIGRNKSHHAAVRSLAFKWIRILFRCWKNGTPYDEQVYMQSLQKHNSPLKAWLPSWKDVAGFQKPSENPA
ncbi:MAG: IS110 family transposase [Candidatus Solibacter usitatus]|nr:IS110 family transposase [Candidatus Solibacter usitatus]